MNRTNIGIFTVAAGFLLIWGGATGRLGNAWGALVHGGTSAPTPNIPDTEKNTDVTQSDCPPGYKRSADGRCLTSGGGAGPGYDRNIVQTVYANGQRGYGGSGSV